MNKFYSCLILFIFYFARGVIQVRILSLILLNNNVNIVDLGYILGLRPFLGLIFVPIWGFINDKYKRARDV